MSGLAVLSGWLLPLAVLRVLDVSSMAPEKAAQGVPITVEGTVTFIQPGMVFFQDATAGSFFRGSDTGRVAIGDQVEVSGKSLAGIYLPGVEAARVRVLAHGPLPAPVQAGYEDLISGRYLYQWVALRGVVRSVAALGESRTLVRLAMGSRIMEVWVELPLRAERPEIDSQVRVEGLAIGTINQQRQLVQPYIRTPDWPRFSVLRPAIPAGAIPRSSGSDLLTYALARRDVDRVRVEGTVMAEFPHGMLYLRDGDTALPVRLATAVPLEVGEDVEVLGFPEMGTGRFKAGLVDAQLAARHPGAAPAPKRTDLEALFSGNYDGNLVQFTARVADAFRTEHDQSLILEEKERRARVNLVDLGRDIPIGSTVQVTGITRVTESEGVGYNSRPDAITLNVRGPEDLVILQRPSWWTTQRLGLGLAMLAAATLLAGLWITLLRRQVSRQAAAARRSIETEVALEERQRLARDFHDTLEQELAGLGLRLDAVRGRGFDEKDRTLIEASRSLVSRIQLETRNLVGDLRQSGGSEGELGPALAELAELNDADWTAAVKLELSDNLPPLPFAAVHNLRMIARESVTNSLKHSGATEIVVRASVRDGALLTLSVSDNGRGFDPAAETTGKIGHYGCIGIRERSAKLGAAVAWRSGPGRGTTVELTMPIMPAARAAQSAAT